MTRKIRTRHANIKIVAIIVVVVVAFGSGLYLTFATAASVASSESDANQANPVRNAVPIPSQVSCTNKYDNGAPLDMLVNLTSTSSVDLCISYFYYNSTSTTTFSVPNNIVILGSRNISGTNATRLYDATSLFSITTTSNQIEIGGPSNIGEASVVVFSIGSTQNTPDGEYYVGFDAMSYPQIANCPTQLDLVVGSGQYYPGGSTCLSLLALSSHSALFQLDSFGLINGLLFDEVVGVSE